MKIFYKSEISSAHRIKNHSGKCRNLHGHNYLIEVEIESDNLDENGFVMDFLKIKEIINRLDHKVILQKYDPLVERLYDQEIFIMDETPSCENIAKLIAYEIAMELRSYKRIRVRVRESKRSYSEFVL